MNNNAKAKPLVKPKPVDLVDTRSISSTNSFQNELDEIRGLIRDSATLYCEAAKLQVENMRQHTEVLGLIRSLTTLILQQQQPKMEMKDSKMFSNVPKTPNRSESRRGQTFAQTQIVTPMRSRSVSRLQGVKTYDL